MLIKRIFASAEKYYSLWEQREAVIFSSSSHRSFFGLAFALALAFAFARIFLLLLL